MKLLMLTSFLVTTILATTITSENENDNDGFFPHNPKCNGQFGHYCRMTEVEELPPQYPLGNATACKPIQMIWIASEYGKIDSPLQCNNMDNHGGLMADEIGHVAGFENLALLGVSWKRERELGALEAAANTFVQAVEFTAENCPETNIVIGGKDLGAGITHIVLEEKRLSADAFSKVKAVPLWNDQTVTKKQYNITDPATVDKIIQLCFYLHDSIWPCSRSQYSKKGAGFVLRKLGYDTKLGLSR